MPDDTPDPVDDDPKPDPDAGAKKALEAERKARRDAEKQLSEMKAKLQELEDRDKSEGEKLAGRIAAAEKRADEAEARALRLEVAAAKGLTVTQARRLVGATKEELEADADDLLASFKPSEPAKDDDDIDEDEPGDEPKPSPTNRPTPALRGGGDPTQPVDPDIRKVVESIPRS